MIKQANTNVFPATRQTDNMVAKYRVPIIFVPGIMGSRFRISTHDVTWDPDSSANMVRWASRWTSTKREILNFNNPGEILLEPADTFDVNHDDRIIRGFGGIRWKSYGQFLNFLEGLRFGSHHTPNYAYGYDWRQHIIQLGVQMAADIIGETVSFEGNRAEPAPDRFRGSGILPREQANKCILLTHSMGGLVARAALKASSILRKKTIAVLHGVQPVTGSPAMYRRMITGMFSPLDGQDALEDKALRSILGTTAVEFGDVASVIPGALQLLPSDLYRQDALAHRISMVSWTVFDENRDVFHTLNSDIYAMYRSESITGPPGLLPSIQTAAIHADIDYQMACLQRFHDFIQRWKLQDKTWAFHGDQVNSDSSVHFDLPPTTILEEKRFLRSKRYTAVTPAGATVELDHERDILRNGYRQQPPGKHSSAQTPWGFGPYGDGTVAALSGRSLFPADETITLAGNTPPDFTQFRQFGFNGLAHEPAYRSGAVQQFCQQWLRYVMSLVR